MQQLILVILKFKCQLYIIHCLGFLTNHLICLLFFPALFHIGRNVPGMSTYLITPLSRLIFLEQFD